MRELSPFMGTIQVIESTGAQASTHNGQDWRILVRVFNPAQQWGSLETPNRQQSVLYGFWSSQNGLETVPLSPLVNPRQINYKAVLVEATMRRSNPEAGEKNLPNHQVAKTPR